MTRKDIDDIISILCPNDEDYEKTCISPAYLKKELEVLALEQEPILDKIRAEIEDLDVFYDNDYFSGNRDAVFKRNEVLAIIDKYRAESEGEK